jgi:hypothetical protein
MGMFADALERAGWWLEKRKRTIPMRYEWQRMGWGDSAQWLCYAHGVLSDGDEITGALVGTVVEYRGGCWRARLEGDMPSRDLGSFGTRREAQKAVEQQADAEWLVMREDSENAP